MSKASKTGKRGPGGGPKPCPSIHLIAALLLLLVFAAAGASGSPPSPPGPPLVTARDCFNAGTHLLQIGKLPEAESHLQEGLARQEAGLQPAALYNLGQVRFALGEGALKKAPDAGTTAERTRSTASRGTAAIETVDAAMMRRNPEEMVVVYRQGKGTRKELSAILKAIEGAMKAHAGVLLKWQRAAADFKSAAELNPAGTNATYNAEIVSRHIARLIDQMQEMQQAKSAAQQSREQLKEKLKQLASLLPEENGPPGSNGDDEEEENAPGSPQPGTQEVASKSGEEIKVSPEESGDLLNGFRLDDGHRLPMGGDQNGKPADPKRPTW